MLKNSSLIVLVLCLFCCFSAVASLKSNEGFLQILQEKDREVQERKLVRYILTYFETKPTDSLAAAKADMDELFIINNIENRPAFNHFIDYVWQQRRGQVDMAERSLVKAIQLVAKRRDKYLLYAFYNELGFLQTFRGNTTEAVYSFSMARKQAVILNNASYQIIACINISDVFYKNDLYHRSLSYLTEAQGLITAHQIPEPRLQNIVYNNLMENYFRMNNVDSVKKYSTLLHALPDGAYKKYIYTKRSDYYLSILNRDHQKAVQQIKALRTDSLYQYNTTDDKHLADAYFNIGMLDSAKSVLAALLVNPSLKNHPEVTFRLHEVLGIIAEQQNDIKTAAYHFKTALQQSKERTHRQTQVDNISSQIKMGEVADNYIQKEEGYKKERQGLIYVLVITLLAVAIIAMIFSATRQRRYYERLMYSNKRNELSFINSHEVRRHLSNLLGLIDVIRTSENKHQQYLEAEPMILKEAESLDGAIKTISEKLDSDIEPGRPLKDQPEI